MRPGEHSLMAERVAVTRALHQVVDDEPRVFADPLALRIIGPDNARWMHENVAGQQTEPMRRVRAMICIRARFSEDELTKALAAGTTQYVVLGAGLDTFAYRRPDLAGRLTVYEVDHPSTQAWKRGCLGDAGIAIPQHLRFVPVDFNEQALGDCLAAAGFRRDQPAFFSWLGVSYYLPLPSITETLGYIGSHGARSQVVFDYAIDKADLPPESQDVWTRVNAFTSKVGEPWQTVFAAGDLMEQLRQLGFGEVFHLTPEEATARYLAGRRDMPGIGPFVGLMSARHQPL